LKRIGGRPELVFHLLIFDRNIFNPLIYISKINVVQSSRVYAAGWLVTSVH
jgi:hypothetical protein